MTEASHQPDPTTGTSDADPTSENDQQADSPDGTPAEDAEHPTGQQQATENAENDPPG